MSPELETLDQLLGGELPIRVVRTFFPDESRFIQALTAMLAAKEVHLIGNEEVEVPQWRWHECLSALAEDVWVRLSPAGARRIG